MRREGRGIGRHATRPRSAPAPPGRRANRTGRARGACTPVWRPGSAPSRHSPRGARPTPATCRGSSCAPRLVSRHLCVPNVKPTTCWPLAQDAFDEPAALALCRSSRATRWRISPWTAAGRARSCPTRRVSRNSYCASAIRSSGKVAATTGQISFRSIEEMMWANTGSSHAVQPINVRSLRYSARLSKVTIGPPIAPEETYRPPLLSAASRPSMSGPETLSATTSTAPSPSAPSRASPRPRT